MYASKMSLQTVINLIKDAHVMEGVKHMCEYTLTKNNHRERKREREREGREIERDRGESGGEGGQMEK